METISLISQQESRKKMNGRCCSWEIVDLSEPLIIVGTCCSLIVLVYSSITGSIALAILSGIVLLSGLVGEWRIRVLGVAKKLMDSVNNLENENNRLRDQVETLGGENQKLHDEVGKFEGIVGILGDTTHDIESAKNELFGLYEKYQKENTRYESNNLLTLFGLVDKDQNSKLDKDEMGRLGEYIKIVYGKEFDFGKLDKDGDGCVSLREFFDKFRQESDNNV